jgi:hypothetical protein
MLSLVPTQKDKEKEKTVEAIESLKTKESQ